MDETTADFVLRLHNEVNGPARSASDAVRRLSGGLVTTREELARTESALLSHWKKQQSVHDRTAATSDRMAQRRTVAFHAGELQQKSAESAARRQAQIQQAGGLGKLAKLEGTQAPGVMDFGAPEAAVLGLVGAAALAATAVGYIAYKFADATVEAIAFGQRSKLAFGFLAGSAEQGAAEFESVRMEAQGLGLDVHVATESFRQLMAMQFDSKTAHDLLRMGADMQALGADSEHVQRILYAISEIKGLGTLQQRQVRMLQMAGISGKLIDDALAARLGTTSPAQIKALQKKGKIGADVAIQAIMDAVRHKAHESNLGEAAGTFANTQLTGMANQAKAMADNAFISFGERLEPAATKVASLMFETFKKLGESPELMGLENRLVSGFDKAAAFIERKWPEIQATVLGGVDFMVKGMNTAIDFATAHWSDISEMIKGTAYVLLGLGAAALIVAAPFIAIEILAFAAAGAVAWLTAKVVEGTLEFGKWAKYAGVALMLTGVGIPAGAALYAAGSVASRNGSQEQVDTIEDSKKRMAENAAAGTGAAANPDQTDDDSQKRGNDMAAAAARAARDAGTMAAGLAGGTAASITKTNTISMPITVEAVEHDGTPENAGDVLGKKAVHHLIEALEEG